MRVSLASRTARVAGVILLVTALAGCPGRGPTQIDRDRAELLRTDPVFVDALEPPDMYLGWDLNDVSWRRSDAIAPLGSWDVGHRSQMTAATGIESPRWRMGVVSRRREPHSKDEHGRHPPRPPAAGESVLRAAATVTYLRPAPRCVAAGLVGRVARHRGTRRGVRPLVVRLHGGAAAGAHGAVQHQQVRHMVFFLVSGYIIPASLERKGCVRTFWIGRVFRIYPLWVAVVAAVLVASLLGVASIRDFGQQSAATVALAHVTMLQELLGTPNLLLVLWTLSYEMAFYLLVVALFTVRLHQRSTAIAVTLAVLAAVSVAAGFTLPASALSDKVGTGPLIGLAVIAMVTAICCASAGSPGFRLFGGLLGGVLALALVPINGTVPMWEGLVILAVMFLGTAVYRAESGQSTWWVAACTAAVVLSCAVGSAYASGDGGHFTRRGWIVAFLLAVLTFGAGLALRRRLIPRWLTGLGTISYSVYLVHPVLLAVTDGTIGRWQRNNPVLEVAFYAVLIPLCVLTYRYVEAPSQTWGRRLARRVQPLSAERVPQAPEVPEARRDAGPDRAPGRS